MHEKQSSSMNSHAKPGLRAASLLALLFCCSHGCAEQPAGTTKAQGHFADPDAAVPSPNDSGEGGPMEDPYPSTDAGLGRVQGCDPGVYTGSYSCKEGFAGPVSFDLVVNETIRQDAQCQEFCSDLVISEESGMLYGNWIILGFQGHLEGGLDCETGEFRATLVDGIAGLPDPSDPKKLIGFNTFEGTLTGEHHEGTTQTIAGEWSLTNADSSCIGTFSLRRGE